jgi:hypothetical protein
MFDVTGGEYADTGFTTLIAGTEEEHGPFATEDEALKVWKTRAMAKIDNCHHRLNVVRRDSGRAVSEALEAAD